jgi:ribosomal protein S8
MEKSRKLSLSAEICHSFKYSKSYRAFLALIDVLKDEGFIVDYNLTRINGLKGELEVYVNKDGQLVNVFSKKETSNWLDDKNISETIEKIKHLTENP